ncbi:hypothetical protein FB451DRAFT_1173285 [Mycena latifolia]|nr:hypothetical protein FB451DRAFT_1173285 [Mycena latifolia]
MPWITYSYCHGVLDHFLPDGENRAASRGMGLWDIAGRSLDSPAFVAPLDAGLRLRPPPSILADPVVGPKPSPGPGNFNSACTLGASNSARGDGISLCTRRVFPDDLGQKARLASDPGSPAGGLLLYNTLC